MEKYHYNFQTAGAEQVAEQDPVTHLPFNPNEDVVYLGRNPQGIPIHPITTISLNTLRQNSVDGQVTNPYRANYLLEPHLVQRLLNSPARYYPDGDIRRLNRVPAESIAVVVGGGISSKERKRNYKLAKINYQQIPTRENFKNYKRLKKLYKFNKGVDC